MVVKEMILWYNDPPSGCCAGSMPQLSGKDDMIFKKSNKNGENSGDRCTEKQDDRPFDVIYVKNVGYVRSSRTGGYSPSGGLKERPPLPKGGTGASGPPRVESGQSGRE